MAALKLENATWFGRASTGLLHLLRALTARFPSRVIALPSFICHSPVAAVVAAGWTPLFVDVDPATANVPDAEWEKAAALGVEVFMLTHMFGNPAPTRALRGRPFVIEDACQAMGAPVGDFGHAVLWSFGHTKVLDVGHGGAVVGGPPLDTAAPPARDESAYINSFYARKAKGELAGLIEDYVPYVDAAWDPAYKPKVEEALLRLDSEVARRRERWAYYQRELQGLLEPLDLAEGAVPWRFVFRYDGRNITDPLRKEGIHVSNWYLPAHQLMRGRWMATGPLLGTKILAASVHQLWLDDSAEATCATLHRWLS